MRGVRQAALLRRAVRQPGRAACAAAGQAAKVGAAQRAPETPLPPGRRLIRPHLYAWLLRRWTLWLTFWHPCSHCRPAQNDKNTLNCPNAL